MALRLAVLAWVLVACTKTEPDTFQADIPTGFPKAVYNFEGNLLSKEGFELGKMLFYDPILSRDGTISCGSCHQQSSAFANQAHRLSLGINSRLGKRNTPAIVNMRWRRDFFWDGGVAHLEVLPLAPLTDSVEMGESLGNVLAKLNADPTYRRKFGRVFDKETIDSQQLLRALAQFTGLLVSADSPYDRHVAAGSRITAIETQGLAVFERKCASCHAPPLFTDDSFRNNGLDTDFSKDAGRELITGLPADRGKFRVPTLRNVALTPPYMHDGRFRTLEAVLEHYQSGVKLSATLDGGLLRGNQPGILLTDEEKTALVAFLKTLTDPGFINNAAFADPN